MVGLLEGMRVGGATPSMEEYLISTNEKSINDKSVCSEEIIKLYGLPEDLHCVAYPLKRQNTEDKVISHSISRGASYYDPIVYITSSFHGSSLEVMESLTCF